MRRVVALIFLVAAAAHPVQGQTPTARAQAESARAAAVAAHDSAQAAVDRAKASAESVRGAPASTATPGELPFAGMVIAILAFLVLLWVMLGRPVVRRWLAQRHGAQVLVLWGAMVLFTFASCASAVIDAFSRTGAHEYTFPIVLVLWLAVVIITWRWASARGAATRVR